MKKFDVCSNTQLADFATNLCYICYQERYYALRILTNGGVLVADGDQILRLDASGTVVQKYGYFPIQPHENTWFALNLDPGGTSFWSAALEDTVVCKFDINTGTNLLEFSADSYSDIGGIGGIAVYGERTAARQTATITVSASPTSGGSVSDSTGLINNCQTSCSASFAAGTNVTLTATARSGYTFANWTENGNVVSTVRVAPHRDRRQSACGQLYQ